MALGSWFPVKHLPPPREVTHEWQIVVNWLYREVDEDRLAKMPALKRIKGWRNIEVYYYIKSYDWTARMFQ